MNNKGHSKSSKTHSNSKLSRGCIRHKKNIMRRTTKTGQTGSPGRKN